MMSSSRNATPPEYNMYATRINSNDTFLKFNNAFTLTNIFEQNSGVYNELI